MIPDPQELLRRAEENWPRALAGETRRRLDALNEKGEGFIKKLQVLQESPTARKLAIAALKSKIAGVFKK